MSEINKLVCFTGIEAPGGVGDVLENDGKLYRDYTVISDGVQKTLNVYIDLDLHGNPGWAMWPGVYRVTLDDAGFVTKTRVAEELLTGYGVIAPDTDKHTIKLGHMETQYSYVPGAALYLFGKTSVPADYLKTADEAESGWDDNWFIKLNESGEITEMWVSHQPSLSDGAIVNEIRKFKTDQGPIADNGLAIEYNYYAPQPKPGVKYPIFVWFHGLHSGTSTWTNLFEFNPIANWAKPEFQCRFREGGAYIITPRANEDLREGHGISWNEAHVEPFFTMIDDFIIKHPDADVNRLFVGGFSMGGIMSWLCIAHHPERLAGAIPCCGMYDPTEIETQASLKVPVFHIHGDGDGDYTDRVRRVMKPYLEANPKSHLTVLEKGYRFPDGNPTFHEHLVWIPALNDFLFYDGSRYTDIEGQLVPQITEFINNGEA